MNDTPLPVLCPTPPGLYRHYKGGWYEVLDTVRCSETLQGMTLYRPLRAADASPAECWVRPAAMFMERANFDGLEQPRFALHDPATLPLADLATAHAVITHLCGRVQRERGSPVESLLRAPPPEPTTCCGRGCNGCVWEGYYTALSLWRDEVLDLLGAIPRPSRCRVVDQRAIRTGSVGGAAPAD